MSTEDRSDMPLHTQTLESLLAAQVTYIASLAPILVPKLSLLLFELKISTTNLVYTCSLANNLVYSISRSGRRLSTRGHHAPFSTRPAFNTLECTAEPRGYTDPDYSVSQPHTQWL